MTDEDIEACGNARGESTPERPDDEHDVCTDDDLEAIGDRDEAKVLMIHERENHRQHRTMV